MRTGRLLLLGGTHVAAAAAGFAAGIYLLPILIAPATPSPAEIQSASGAAQYRGQFRRDLKGSDFLHWGEGTVSIGARAISLAGKVSPGPDYKLYLSPEFVDSKEGFLRVKPAAVRVGDVKTFENFIVPVPLSADVSRYNTVVVWCETFSMFITAAKYR